MLEMVSLMMAQANLLISYWGDALLSPTYILNHVSFKSVFFTLCEFGRVENSTWISCIHRDLQHTFLTISINLWIRIKGKKCIFVRYFENSKSYVFIGEYSNRALTEIKSCDVTFLENHFPTRGDDNKDHHLF